MSGELAQRIRDLAGDVREMRKNDLPPDVDSNLAAGEAALERAAARADLED